MARLTKEEQKQLVAIARTGDEAAIARLYNDIAPIIRRSLRRLVSDNDIDDIVQGTMTKAILRIDQYRDDASFSTWCVKIAKNDGLHLRRKDRRMQRVIVDSIDNTMTPEGQMTQPIDVGYEDRTAEQNLASKIVHQTLSQLNPLQERAIRLKLDGYSIEDIAITIGMTLVNTKNLIYRGQHAMRKIIEGPSTSARVCLCGCGSKILSPRGPAYIRGHRSRVSKAA